MSKLGRRSVLASVPALTCTGFSFSDLSLAESPTTCLVIAHGHERAAAVSLARGLGGIVKTEVTEHWPIDGRQPRNISTLVLYSSPSEPMLDSIETFLRGAGGLIAIHRGLDAYGTKPDRTLAWTGGVHEAQVSDRQTPTWLAGFSSFPQHPINRGLAPFSVEENWTVDLRLDKRVAPILKATPPSYVETSQPGREQTLAWAFQRDDGGRSFGLAGGRYPDLWRQPSMVLLIRNAIAWTASSVASKPRQTRHRI